MRHRFLWLGRARDRSGPAGRLFVRRALPPDDAVAPRRGQRTAAARPADRLAHASQEPLGAGAVVRTAGLRRRSAARRLGRAAGQLRAPQRGLRAAVPGRAAARNRRRRCAAQLAGERLQPYRVESLSGQSDGQLTSYYEPVYEASRRPTRAVQRAAVPRPRRHRAAQALVHAPQIESLPEAQAALRGREIAWMADPIDAMVLHIQGTGRLRIAEPDGSQRTVRVAFSPPTTSPTAASSNGCWRRA